MSRVRYEGLKVDTAGIVLVNHDSAQLNKAGPQETSDKIFVSARFWSSISPVLYLPCVLSFHMISPLSAAASCSNDESSQNHSTFGLRGKKTKHG